MKIPWIKFERMKEVDGLCEHMAPILDLFRTELIEGNVRILTQHDDCPLFQCRICKIEVLMSEPWLGFYTEGEREQNREFKDMILKKVRNKK